MSRSTKRHGWCTDGSKHGKGVKFAKFRANRRVRRFSEEMPQKGKFFRRLFQPYKTANGKATML